MGKGRPAALGVLLVLTSCTGGPASPEPASVFDACQDVLFVPHGDVAAGMGFGWDAKPHAWGDTVDLRVCLAGITGTVTFDPMPGVTLDPPTGQTPPGTPAAVTFRVTVGSGAAGPLRLRVTSTAPQPALGEGPTIAADGTGWRFVRPAR